MAMKSLKIPQPYQFGIKLIIEIDEPIFDRLLSAITEVHPFVDIASLALKISPKIEEIPINDLEEILRAIRSFYSLRTQENLKNTEIITGLIDAVSSDETFSELSSEELENFEKRLTKLLAIDGSISISSKAITLLQEYDHIFSSSRIVNDIRPIFKPENEKEIAGALIVHTLKIAYQDAGDLREFYVALDSADVKNLQEQLSQCLIEGDAIQAMLEKADVLYLDPHSSSK
ncbi:hypothetical protein [Anabaena sp. UHCC 0451]|uniref:hypothetical protein n=1 Tax=Anabaena sp. UHCC 0451 TaxID=2055235 RepID=UPI002B20C6AD|nr:hypothetical protein [Anabaena sp. UHCC 0451]MEA5579025.1 hypothetical protein [Anabaena sp. UHCC 0451]